MDKFSPTGALQLIAAQFIIGFNLVIAKSVLPHLSVFILLFLRFGFGSLIALAINGRNNATLLNTLEGSRLTRIDHLYLIAQALTAGFLFNLLMMIGMQYTSAGAAGLITSIIPAAIAGLSVIFLKERMNASRLISMFLALGGLVVLNIHSGGIAIDGKNLLGQFIILLSVFPEALFTIIAKLHRTNISTLNKVIYMNVYNFLMFVPLGLWYVVNHGLPVMLSGDWIKTLLYGLNSVLFFVLWYKGLEKMSAIVSGIYTAIAPCATILLAYIFLGEPVYASYIFTFVLIFLSIVIGSGLLKHKLFISLF